jgi:hypothetical protein
VRKEILQVSPKGVIYLPTWVVRKKKRLIKKTVKREFIKILKEELSRNKNTIA